MKKIILYHGTDIETAKKISNSGLKPTHDSKQSNWTENPSRTDSVYLTDTFAVKFGLIASECNDRLNDFAIITVEVNEDDLYPDEDFLAQIPKCLYESLGLDIEVADYDLTKKTHYFKNRLDDFKYLWKDSLRWLGTVSHRGAITKDKIKNVSCETIDNLSLSADCEKSAEVNFGYKLNHERYHKLQIKKIIKRLNLRKENQLITHSKEVMKCYLVSQFAKTTFYDTTGNPNVDKKVYLHNGGLMTTSILTDMYLKQEPKPKYKSHELEYLHFVGDPTIEKEFTIAYGVKK